MSCQSQNKESTQNSIHNNTTLELNKKDLLKPQSNAELESAFFKAIESGNNSEVISLVQSGVDIYARDYAGFGAVAKAAWSGNAEILIYLLSLGLSPNGEDKKIIPLLVAKDFSTAQILIESGADINQSNGDKTPIERYFEHLPYMLSKGADIHLMGEANALFLAASDEQRFSLLTKLLPFEQNQEAYNDALFLTLRAGEEYPYNLSFELSLPIDNNDEEAKKARISLIQNQEAKIHRLKNAGATITPLLEQFANQY
ncbi:MAG: ankyrin repeat domain-containing protein, partial [Helicobacter japonicus]|nr:ankyrin repeat domain-containing protein [Helicobacter japonicus]